MLPESLSNNLCSLRPNEDKYTFSAVFTFQDNIIVDQWFGKTVINSDHRFSYQEVQEVIENKNIIISKEVSLKNKEYKIEENVKQAILLLNKLASVLRIKRMNSGAISFEKKEVKFYLDTQAGTINLYSSSSANVTFFTFKRLGDT